ncbi:hypothetical protein HFP15_20745 [Amycolatopsis sp. K13G38]|uniref:50S ribosomal protein L34e n=1 Tax=Amycolatopsis acididurans TaxID=2724524 RepID=A0ABX1J6C9_9PSEU|nr:hypothetical protein [Amycolatopsis acididurans]NKQ55318.1 hypothetical protein [Amycolatopsis acididurans]
MDSDVAVRRVFRRVVCPRCGQRRTEMRVFGVSRQGRTRWRVHRELRAQAKAWHPEPLCDRCRREWERDAETS